MFGIAPVIGKIISVKYQKFDFSKQFWVTVETITGAQIRARLTPEDLPYLEAEGYDVSQWGIQRCKTVHLSTPIFASFLFNGVVFTLCEVLLNDPFAVPALEYETHEDDDSRRARIAALDGYESLTDREDLHLWLDTHPDRCPDLCHVFGDRPVRGEIDKMYLLPPHLGEKEYLNDFMRNMNEDWERNYRNDCL